MNQLMIVPTTDYVERMLPVPVLTMPKRFGKFETHPRDIIDAAASIARQHGITNFVPKSGDERGNKLKRTNVAILIRWAMISLILERCEGISYSRVGKLIGRDHSTISYAVSRFPFCAHAFEPFRQRILGAMACARVKG